MSTPVAEPLVHLQVTAGVATVTLDSPRNRNALSRRLVAELAGHLRGALADEAVRVVVLTHTGPVFCSGADLEEAREARPDDAPAADLPDVLLTLWESEKPVVCRLAGPVRAGGIGLVAACDLAVAARDVTLAFPEVRLGLVPAIISVVCLPRMRPRDAAELFLTGDVVDADRAVAAGLLTRAVAPEDLDGTVAGLCASLVQGSPSALAATKRLVHAAVPGPTREAFDAAAALSAARFASEEGQEGIRARREKRPPRWVPDL